MPLHQPVHENDDPMTSRNRNSQFFYCITLWMASLLLPAQGSTQVILHSDEMASSGSNTAHNIVRDGDGDLHCASLERNAAGEMALIVQSSTDGGATWDLQPPILNDGDSGLFDPNPATQCSVAIDDQGILHLLWGCYIYPSYYRQFYRRFDPGTGDRSDIVEISVLTGAPLTSRTAAMDIVVDSENTVWICGHYPSSWVEHLLRSDQPYASDDAFTDLGAISPTASAQNTRLAVDASGQIHCTFYRNIGPGQYEHRIYDPITGWQPDTFVLGDTSGSNDYFGWVSTDNLGQLHCAYVIDSTAGSPLWKFRYRIWDEISGWSDETILFDANSDQFTGISSYRIFNIGCDEETGTVHAVYRDLAAGGALVLATKLPVSPEFEVIAQLQPTTLGEHAYIYPTVRGTLYPAFNNTSLGLDITYQRRDVPGTPPYSLVYQDASQGSAILFIRGDGNEDGSFNVADIVFGLNALFVPGGVTPSCIESCDLNDDGGFNIADMVYGLNSLFIPGSAAPPLPYPDCGQDPIGNAIDCPVSSVACP